jgi:DNA-binding NtrC family response regulator
VLIVEDEAVERAIAADIFDKDGFDVLEAADADEASAILNGDGPIGALFTDIEMPGSVDGLALARLCRIRHPRAAVIVTSGKVEPLNQDIPAGAKFLSKPYDLENVTDLLWDMVGRPPAV